MADTSELAAAEGSHLCRYKLLLAAAESGCARPVDAPVETNACFQELGAEAEYPDDGREPIAPALAHRRTQISQGLGVDGLEFSGCFGLLNDFDEAHDRHLYIGQTGSSSEL